METIVKMTEDESKALERVWYERRCLMNLIGYFTSLCKETGAGNLLGEYIQEYKRDLEMDTVHEIMLRDDVTRNHLSNEEYAKFQSADYTFLIDFDTKEIKYYYGEQ